MMFYKGYNIHNITKIEKCKHIVTSSIFSDCYVVQYVFVVEVEWGDYGDITAVWTQKHLILPVSDCKWSKSQ